MRSQFDNSVLPDWWQQSPKKPQVIAYLQGRTLGAPYWWDREPFLQRRTVVLHLCAVGSVNAREHARVRKYGLATSTATRKAEQSKPAYHTFDGVAANVETHGHAMSLAQVAAYRARFPDSIALWDRYSKGVSESTPIQGMLYPKPNGGKRILPSIYTRLRDTWLRANGVYQEPAKMNQGHLKNTVNLLNESHMNLVDRMCELFGKMHGHLSNRPDLQAKLVDLFHDFEALQVDEVYPIVEFLASHIELTQDDVDFDPRTLENWSDGDF